MFCINFSNSTSCTITFSSQNLHKYDGSLYNTTITCKFYIPNYDPAFNNIKQSSSVLQNNVIHCFEVFLCSIATQLLQLFFITLKHAFIPNLLFISQFLLSRQLYWSNFCCTLSVIILSMPKFCCINCRETVFFSF